VRCGQLLDVVRNEFPLQLGVVDDRQARLSKMDVPSARSVSRVMPMRNVWVAKGS